jgi:hypothetical protein
MECSRSEILLGDSRPVFVATAPRSIKNSTKLGSHSSSTPNPPAHHPVRFRIFATALPDARQLESDAESNASRGAQR